ncbi:MAG: MBL fold metallo-hydrolase [Candidatus Lokiarchaeota archaeon]|nr:MBL fold metallo-hydrolase [Candidatus Lokiarchaeota archaeon]MBD3201837.1 MBL fold metallo-hydrolase [Candidatus Lokiarchaeota archaeon]
MKDRKVDSLKKFFLNDHMEYDCVSIAWLGQAGFIFKYNEIVLIIDPYLSDYLAKKYKGKIFPHIRLMDLPIKPDEISRVNYVLSTHPHSDHMDPETISILSETHRNCNFIVPGPEKEEAIKRGINKDQIIEAYVDREIEITEEIKIIPIPAKHEEFKVNKDGEHSFLGYIFKFGDTSLYHSGDSIPYEGLVDKLKRIPVNIALMPINGRDEYRLSNNIAGNFLIPEVIKICQEANIKKLIVHHFGMFSYNTVPEKRLSLLKTKNLDNLKILVPEVNHIYSFKVSTN